MHSVTQAEHDSVLAGMDIDISTLLMSPIEKFGSAPDFGYEIDDGTCHS